MPAEYTGISWPEEEQPQSLNHRSSAWGLGPLCSSLEVAHRRSFSPGSLFLPKRGNREPGPAPGLSTLLGSSFSFFLQQTSRVWFLLSPAGEVHVKSPTLLGLQLCVLPAGGEGRDSIISHHAAVFPFLSFFLPP